MRIRVYIWIEGDDFLPQVFRNGLPDHLKGEIAHRKRVRQGAVENVREHWVSPSFEVRNHEEAISKLYSLVLDLEEFLKAVSDSDAILMAEVVSHCDTAEDAHGFYLSADLMRLFARVGMALDIDQYYHDDESGDI